MSHYANEPPVPPFPFGYLINVANVLCFTPSLPQLNKHKLAHSKPLQPLVLVLGLLNVEDVDVVGAKVMEAGVEVAMNVMGRIVDEEMVGTVVDACEVGLEELSAPEPLLELRIVLLVLVVKAALPPRFRLTHRIPLQPGDVPSEEAAGLGVLTMVGKAGVAEPLPLRSGMLTLRQRMPLQLELGGWMVAHEDLEPTDVLVKARNFCGDGVAVAAVLGKIFSEALTQRRFGIRLAFEGTGKGARAEVDVGPAVGAAGRRPSETLTHITFGHPKGRTVYELAGGLKLLSASETSLVVVMPAKIVGFAGRDVSPAFGIRPSETLTQSRFEQSNGRVGIEFPGLLTPPGLAETKLVDE
ncbi:MAG: hypothetical protein Q9208_007933 [Pyrenodesmia sp. 3 TL-2023]